MKEKNLYEHKSKEDISTLCKVKCAAGLAELNSKRYKQAAKYFLAANFENFNFNDVIYLTFSIFDCFIFVSKVNLHFR